MKKQPGKQKKLVTSISKSAAKRNMHSATNPVLLGENRELKKAEPKFGLDTSTESKEPPKAETL